METDHVYIAMFGGLPGKPTGLAMSVLRRAEAFAEAGIRSQILVDQFYPDFDCQLNELVSHGRVGGSVSVRFMYHDLAGRTPEVGDSTYRSPLGGPGWAYTAPIGRPDMLVGKYNGEYRHRVLLRDEKVLFIDHLDSGQWDRREWFDGNGWLCKIDRMGSLDKPKIIEFIDRGGNCYLRESRDERTQRVLTLDVHPGTAKSVTFTRMVDLFKYWMQRYVIIGDPEPTIISEYAIRRVALKAMEKENNARIIYTIHSNHLSKPHRYGAKTRLEMVDLFAHLDEHDAVVVLTNEQRQDIWKEYGRLETIHVIPHYVPGTTGESVRNPKKVVMVGRFEPVKGQIVAVGAFKQVVAAVPGAKLELYGRGADQEAIEKEIRELGLTDSVTIMGFTADADQVFRSAAMSIVASSYEGFCLSLAESMAQGCVPVAFDIKYGPRDLVRNGVDGFLVEHGNENELADALILGLSNPDHLAVMSESATDIKISLSKSRFVKEWRQVLNS